MAKAIQIVTLAVEEDEKRNYKDAYYAYCEGLHYFVPLIAAEADATKREMLQQRATTYMERAEEIKRSYTDAFDQHKNSKKDEVNDQVEAPCSSTENPVKQALKPASNYKRLCMFKFETPKPLKID